MNKDMNQKNQVLNYLFENGSITGAQAFTQLHVYRLSSVINRLRKDGHAIKTDMSEGFARYSLLVEE